MRRLAVNPVVVVLALAGAGARAQPVVQRFDFDGQSTVRWNADDCSGDPVRMFLQVQVTEPQYQLRFVEYPRSGPRGGCPTDRNEPLAVEVLPEETQTPIAGEILIQRDVEPALLMGPGSCAAADDPDAARRAENYFCVQFFLLPADLTAVGVASATFDVDTTLPAVPTVTGVRGGDGVVFVDVEEISSAEGDAISFIVQHRVCPDADGAGEGEGEGEDVESLCGATAAFSETAGAAPTLEIPVENGTRVELRVLSVDDFGNRSPPTDLQLAEPVADLSPLALYDGAENALSCDPSGCGDSDAAALVGGFALLRLRRRRNGRRRVGAGATLAGLILVALATPAAAREDDRPWPGLGRSTLAFGVSSYRPNLDVDSTFPVYDCMFEGATLPRFTGDADLHLWDGFGSLQLTTGLELAQATGLAQPVRAATTGECEEPTDTKVQLSLAMVRGGVTYRFDPLLDWWNVPLVPYGRIGVLGTGYLFSKDGQTDLTNPSHHPVGARLGWEAAAGLMLALDFLDGIDPFTPNATRRARANGIFDHTFFFVEGARQDVTTFGAPGFDLSPRDDLLGTGLPVSWKAGVAVELL